MTKFELIIVFCIVVPLLLCQAAWIFIDAKKRKERHYWLWGLFGLINVPESLIVYLIVTRIIFKRHKRKV
jgi:hypothetical protein